MNVSNILEIVLLLASFFDHASAAMSVPEEKYILKEILTSSSREHEIGTFDEHATLESSKADAESMSLLQMSAFVKGFTVPARKSEHHDKHPIAYFYTDWNNGTAYPATAKRQDNFSTVPVLHYNVSSSVSTALGQGKEMSNATELSWRPPTMEEEAAREKTVDSMSEVIPSFFAAADGLEWTVLAVTAIVLCLFDYFVIQPILPSTPGWHLIAVLFWLLIALAFTVYVWCYRDGAQGFSWLTGYFLEWILSIENLFVFTLVFEAYKTPQNQMHKAVFIGILGAAAMRLAFYLLLNSLLQLFMWFKYVVGAFLVWSGIEMGRSGDDDDYDITETKLVKGFKWMLGDRLREAYDPNGPSVFMWSDSGHLQVTVLFLVIFCNEIIDIVFAVDSVSAKLTQIPSEYISFSSTIVAMFGLRAGFFIIHDLVEMFETLKYGLCFILIFVGWDLLLHRWIHIPVVGVCFVILGIFAFSIVVSLCKKKANTKQDQGYPAEACLNRES